MRISRACGVPALLLALLGAQALAQRKPALPDKYKRWLNEEVVYLISDEERKTFLQLTADDAREAFIKDFWEVRNPLRGSEQNPFKEEYRRRVQYANENFGRESGTPGWRTDMGRTYILFGKPASHVSVKGYSQIYPMELWFYSNNTGNPSLPPFFSVLFFIPDDIGDYRFYHPIIDGPMKLVRGTQFGSNRDVYNFLKPLGGDIARAPFSLIPSEPMDTQDFSPNMSGEMLVNKIREFANDSFEVKRIREMRFLKARVSSWFLVAQQQPLDVTSIVLSDPEGHYWLDYGVLIDDKKYGRVDPGGDRLVVNIGFRLLTDKGELIAEDAEERGYQAFDPSSSERNLRPFVLANRIPVVPGNYKLAVQVTNREAGKTYKGERSLTAGRAERALLSGPLLTAGIQQAVRPDPDTPFQYFGVQFLPNIERRFAPAAQVRALFQIHLPAGDAHNYELEYVLANVQNRVARQTLADKIAAADFKDGALLKAKTLPLGGLEPGDYRAVFNLKAEGSREVLASSIVPFRIGEEPAPPEFYLLSNLRGAGRNGVAAYLRALESMAQKDLPGAAGYLRQALDQAPSNSFASRTLVQLYFNSRQYDRVTALYDRLGIEALKTAPETLVQVALSFWERGNAESARRVLAAAKLYFPKDTLLVAAAKKIEKPAPAISR